MRFVVEADGGSRGNPGPASFGALVRDADTGAVLAEAAETIGTTTNNVAEYRGLLAGLRLALALDPGADVEVRMDSKLVVEQMAGRWKIKHPDLRPLATEASRVLPRPVAAWTWVPRDRNKRADQLANAALDGRVDEVLRHPLPGRDSGTGAAEPLAHEGATAEVGAGPGVDGAPESSVETAAPPVEVGSAPVGTQSVPSVPATPMAVASTGPTRTRAPEPGRAASSTTVLLLRHGRTADDTLRRFSGPRGTDPGLDEVGRHQAVVVAAALADAGLAAVVSSPLRRARETAQVVATALGLGVVVDDAFLDFDPGSWDGSTTDEVRTAFPAWHAAWSVSPDVAPPDGESVRAVQARVLAGVRALAERYRGRRVLLVSHAVPIGCALTGALEAPLASALRLHIANGSLSVVRHPIDGPPRVEAVALPAGTLPPV